MNENEDKNWIEIVSQNEKNPFAIDKGELVRVFIIPSESNTQIMIMAHHLAGDGKSIHNSDYSFLFQAVYGNTHSVFL